MSIKEDFVKIFKYTPQKNYNFDILESTNKPSLSSLSPKLYSKVQDNLLDNLDFIKSSYNALINSDISIREFTLNARNVQYNAFLVYIDGLIDTNIMNDFILKPLMLRNQSNSYNANQKIIISEKMNNNVLIRKVKKINLSDYLLNSLMPQNSVKIQDSFKDIFSGINAGNCALFVNTLNIAFDIEVKGFKQRSINSPNNEVVIKGSQEAFVENLRTNTSILRRIINNENLIIENIEIGKITKTKCALCYIQNITNTDLVGEARFRLNNLAIDSLTSSRRIRTINI